MSGLAPAAAFALPQGPQAAAGQVSVKAPTASTLVLQQSTNKAVIDWTSFSIQAGESVDIFQPSSHAVLLNRVTGIDPSLILGNLSANGEVFLVNPRGIVFGAHSQVSAGSLVASTLGLSDQDFLAGRYAFSADPAGSPGSLEADGRITARDGTVALVAPEMTVTGTVQGARVGLAAASTTSVDVEGDGLVFFDARNDGLAARLDMLGRLQATGGGTVDVRAVARAGFADTVLNLDGVVQARSLGMHDGRIVIDGGQDGIVSVTGRLDASGHGDGETGGTVKVLGQDVGLFDGARIDVSGHDGGGSAIVGGDLHGAGPDADAQAVFVGKDVRIDADALGHGNGGQVVAWSDGSTQFHGTVIARGGQAGGDGGFVETSSRVALTVDGRVDTSAAAGAAGTWLLDPSDIDIVAHQAPAQAQADAGTRGAFSPEQPGSAGTIDAGAIAAALATGNVTMHTSGDSGGTATIGAAIQWNSSHSLSITADQSLDIGAAVGAKTGSTTQGNITLIAGTDMKVLANVESNGGAVTLRVGQDNTSSTFEVGPGAALSGRAIKVIGGNGNDTFVFDAGAHSFLGSVAGGTGQNTLEASDAGSRWSVTGVDKGDFQSQTDGHLDAKTEFLGIQALNAGAAGGTLTFTAQNPDDSITLNPSQLLSGPIASESVVEAATGFTRAVLAGKSGTYTIDASTWAQPLTVNAAPGIATVDGNGAATTLAGTTTSSIYTVTGIGSDAANTLVWPSRANTNTGTNTTTFNGVGTLAGRSGGDTFVIQPDVAFTGQVSGVAGGSGNTLQAPAGSTWTVTGAGSGGVALFGAGTAVGFSGIQDLDAAGGTGTGGQLDFTAISRGDSIVLTTAQLRSGHLSSAVPPPQLPLLENLSGFDSAHLAGNANTAPSSTYTIDVAGWSPNAIATIVAAPGRATLDGSGTGTTLVGTAAPSVFTIRKTTGSPDSTLTWHVGSAVETTAFDDVGTLDGGSDHDTFAVQAGVDFDTVVNGLSSAGHNTLTAPGAAAWTVTGGGAGAVTLSGSSGRAIFSNIQNLASVGGAGGGTIVFQAQHPGDSIYLSGTELLSGPDSGSGPSHLPLLENLSGFTKAFLSGNAGTLPGTPYGVDVSAWPVTSSATITAEPGQATYAGNGLLTTLLGQEASPATFMLTGSGTHQSANGTLSWGLNSSTFTNVGNFWGSSDDDTFVIQPGVDFAGFMTGNDPNGANTLEAPAGSAWAITGAGSGSVALFGTPGVARFGNIQNLDAASGPGSGSGGTLSFTALAPGVGITLTDSTLQTQARAGAPMTVIENLTGFTAAYLAGNAGTAASVPYTVDVSQWSPASSATITVAQGAATLVGNGSATTIQGTPVASTFNLTASDGGTVAWKNSADHTAEVSTFSDVGHVVGGRGKNTFVLASGVDFAGTIDGGTGLGNTLRATDGTNTWTLLATDAGTLDGATFHHIQSLVGGSGADTFVGFASTSGGAPLLHGTIEAGSPGGPPTTVSGFLTTGGSQTYLAPVLLAGDTSVASQGGSIRFAGTVDGPWALQTATPSMGSTTFMGAVGSDQPLATLTTGVGGTGMTRLSGPVTTSGDQAYDNATSGTGITLTATGGNVTANDGANAFAGTLTVSAGNLSLANGRSLGVALGIGGDANIGIQGALGLSGQVGVDLVTSATQSTTFGASTSVGGAASITSGSGLSGTGAVAVLENAGGALSVAGNLGLDATGHRIVLANDGNRFATVSVTEGYDVALGSAQGFTVDAAQVAHDLLLDSPATITLTGPVSGAGGLTVAGPGTVQVATAQPYTGGTVIDGGTLTLDGAAAAAGAGQAITVGPHGTLNVQDGATVANPVVGDGGTIADLAGTGTLAGPVRLDAGTTFSVPATAGGLTVGGAMSAANVGVGATIAGGGMVIAGPTATLAPQSTFTVGDGSTLALASDQTVGGIAGAGIVDLQGHALTTGANGSSQVFSGAIESTGESSAGSLTKVGTGTLRLAGVDTYTGTTSVLSGRLVLAGADTTPGDAGALANASPVSVAPGAVLEVARSETVDAINGSAGGTIQVDGQQVLTLGSAGHDVQLDAVVTGAGALAKVGADVLTLTADNSFTGGTTIAGGVLQVGKGGASGTLGSGAIVDDAALRFDRSDAFTVANAIVGSGGELDQIAGQLTLSSTRNTYGGPTHVVGGALVTAGAQDLPAATAVTVDAGGTLTLGGAQTLASIAANGVVRVGGDVKTSGDQTYDGGLVIDAPAPVQLTAATLTATSPGNQIGTQPLSVTARTANLASGQALTLGTVTLAQGGSVTAPTLALAGNLDLGGGILTLVATAPADPSQARADAPGHIPGKAATLAIAAPTVTQGAGSAIQVSAGAQLNVQATGRGSVELAQSANQFDGGLAVLSGLAYGGPWLPNVQGSGAAAVGVQSEVDIAGGNVVIANGGGGATGSGAVEADIVHISANALSTASGAQITARLPFDNQTQGTSLSVPALVLTLGPAAFGDAASFGASGGTSQQIHVAIGLTGPDGFNEGYMTVMPKNGAKGSTAIYLSGPVAGTGKPAYHFLYDGAGTQSDVPVFYNGLLPQTPQVAGAVSAVAATGEQERRKRFDETVRTENVTARLRSGVIAEVGPGRPATTGTDGAAAPPLCGSAAGNPFACGGGRP